MICVIVDSKDGTYFGTSHYLQAVPRIGEQVAYRDEHKHVGRVERVIHDATNGNVLLAVTFLHDWEEPNDATNPIASGNGHIR